MPPLEKRQRTLVKICGVRSPEEAEQMLQAGADAVGVVVAAGSPRQVDLSQALKIAETASPRGVLVLRDPSAEHMEFARKWPGPIQLHAPFTPPGRRHIRALAAGSAEAPSGESGVAAWLLDAPVAGSGEPWAWPSAGALPIGAPIILAGGLHPGNVAKAIRTTQPWAVDVSSGVEASRGVKDMELVRAFIEAVRACDLQDGRTLQPTPADFASLR
jgi:phosphoribosylanthranilate isomerase